MKTSFLLRVVYICTCLLLLLPEAKAQDSRPTLTPERIKADFMQQGHEQQLTTAWTQNNELVWEPQWNDLFSTQVEGKETLLVPLLPKLQSKSTHKILPFKLVGARRYLVVADGGNALIYQFLTLAYDDKKNQVQEADSKFLAAFNGTILRQAIGGSYVALSTYKNGQRQAVVSKPSLGKAAPSPSAKTSGLICSNVYTCYWSAYCSTDGVTYGSTTTGTGFCAAPFGPAGLCFVSRWDLTDSRIYQNCYYDNADFLPDWGPGPVPANRPCPGDPLVAMNIAASSKGTPGNIRGGTFGPDVRTLKDGTKKRHEGIDLEAEPGTPVYAGIAGEVIDIKSSFAPGEYKKNSYGNYVYIKNVDGTYSKYNHLDGITQGLSVGDKINRGVQIGISGSTGNATNVPHKHVHLQMFNSSRKPINPQPYLGTPFDMKTGKGIRPC